MIRIAINVVDILRIDGFMRGVIFGDKLDTTTDVLESDGIGDRMDEMAVAFKCGILQAASLCDVIRIRDRNHRVYPTRVYVQTCGSSGRGEGWEKISHSAVLTKVKMTSDRGVIYLNPRVFPIGIQMREIDSIGRDSVLAALSDKGRS